MARDVLSGRPRTSAAVVRGQTEGDLAYLSGGTTVGGRTTMHAERGRYSLWVATVVVSSAIVSPEMESPFKCNPFGRPPAAR